MPQLGWYWCGLATAAAGHRTRQGRATRRGATSRLLRFCRSALQAGGGAVGVQHVVFRRQLDGLWCGVLSVGSSSLRLEVAPWLCSDLCVVLDGGTILFLREGCVAILLRARGGVEGQPPDPGGRAKSLSHQSLRRAIHLEELPCALLEALLLLRCRSCCRRFAPLSVSSFFRHQAGPSQEVAKHVAMGSSESKALEWVQGPLIDRKTNGRQTGRSELVAVLGRRRRLAGERSNDRCGICGRRRDCPLVGRAGS